MLCAPIGGVLINTISPLVLDRDEDDKSQVKDTRIYDTKTYDQVE
jgi:hypothetical protein